MDNRTDKESEEPLVLIKGYEAQIASNIKELANVDEIYKLPPLSLINILDSTEPLDITTGRIIIENIKKNYPENSSSQILSHVKISKESESSLCNQLKTILSSIKQHPLDNNIIKIFVKTLTGKHITIEINQNETVISLKKLIEKQEGIPIDQQSFIFAGKQLEDEVPLNLYDIEEGSTLHLIIRLRG